jgi:signal transduction histidine kinase
MRERATNIGASFSVKALPAGGTEVRVNLSADEGSWRGLSPAR